MVQTFATNSSNDIYLNEDGNIEISTGLQAVLGACETVSKSQLGEMVLAQNAGIPNFQTIWIGVPNYSLWESYLREALLNVSGVQQVLSVVIAPINNVLSYEATILTDFGTGTVNG